MPRFFTNEASFNDLHVSGSTIMSASSGITTRIIGSGSTILSVSGAMSEILRVSDTNNATIFSISSGSNNILEVDSTRQVIMRVSGSTTTGVKMLGIPQQTASFLLTYISESGVVGYSSASNFTATNIQGGQQNYHTIWTSPTTISSSRVMFETGSKIGIGIDVTPPTHRLDINYLNGLGLKITGSYYGDSTSPDNSYVIGNLIESPGYAFTAGSPANQTYDVFSVGKNTSTTSNANYFFRVNLNGGNSTGSFGASGNNNALVHLNSVVKSTLRITAQGQGLDIYGQTSLGGVITTKNEGENLYLRSDRDGTTFAGGGIYYYASANGANFGHRWFHNLYEQMRLSNRGNLTIGYTGSIHPTESYYRFAVTRSSDNNDHPSGSANIDNMLYVTGSRVGINIVRPTSNLHVIGTTTLSSSAETTTLTMFGSASSATPLLVLSGSKGDLIKAWDIISGSVLTVNNDVGVPVMDVLSNGTIKMGLWPVPGMYTSYRSTIPSASYGTDVTIYSIPTSSYDAAFFDYHLLSGSNMRVGQFMAGWSGSNVEYSEVTTGDFGNTSFVTMSADVSYDEFRLRAHSSKGNWTIKTIIRVI